MRFPLLQPRWLGIHLVAVLAVVGCLVLGYWQFSSAQEPDRDTVTNPVEDLAQATDIGTLLEPGAYMDPDLANEAVRATGVFDAENQLFSPVLSPEGQEGYHVVAPLVTGDGSAVTVNRGWVPADAVGTDGAIPAAPSGEVTVSGWLLPPQSEASRGYAPIAAEGQVARIAPALLVNEWPYPLYEGYVTLAEQRPAASAGAASQLREVAPPEPPREISWNFRSLGYSGQWVVFALAALAFWISLVRRERAAHRSPDPTDTQPSTVGAGTGAG